MHHAHVAVNPEASSSAREKVSLTLNLLEISAARILMAPAMMPGIPRRG